MPLKAHHLRGNRKHQTSSSLSTHSACRLEQSLKQPVTTVLLAREHSSKNIISHPLEATSTINNYTIIIFQLIITINVTIVQLLTVVIIIFNIIPTNTNITKQRRILASFVHPLSIFHVIHSPYQHGLLPRFFIFLFFIFLPQSSSFYRLPSCQQACKFKLTFAYL